ncbi:MAG: heparinase II/III family protein [Thermotogae bacterium]|nr:heparinase II/III family protein [Thermotogota bacterium]
MYTTIASEKSIEYARKLYKNSPWYKEMIDKMERDLREISQGRLLVPLERGIAFYETCPEDNTPLIFDPFDPSNRKCPKCGKNYTGFEYYLSWVRSFHFWLSEKAAQFGILYAIKGNERYSKPVIDIISQYSNLYLWYRHRDNELGPGRIFPSTYMESLWLGNLIIGLSLVKDSIDAEFINKVKDNLFYPAVYTIMDYDEGMNNRQAMNNYGMGSVGFFFENPRIIEYSLEGPHGLFVQLENGVLDDGMWYEGNNYHWPTLKTLILLSEIANENGIKIYEGKYGDILKKMFYSQIDSMMPDGTFPSRKDSEYARNLGDYSSLYEIAYMRFMDEHLGKFLASIYAKKSRSDNEWYSSFSMREDIPSRVNEKSHSILMPATGLAIFRSDKVYSYLDYGYHGGGHGHPDKLHLTFVLDGVRFFEDPGTCNYLFKELFWYRSTRAHNTLIVNGKDQELYTTGKLRFYGNIEGFQVVSVQVDQGSAYPNSGFRRTFVLTDNYAIDVMEGFSGKESIFDLNWNTYAGVDADLSWENSYSFGEEAGKEFIKNAKMSHPSEEVLFEFKEDEKKLYMKSIFEPGDLLLSGKTPGRPSRMDWGGTILIHRKRGRKVKFVNILSWSDIPEIVNINETSMMLKLKNEHHRILINTSKNIYNLSIERDSKPMIFYGYNSKPKETYRTTRVKSSLISTFTLYRGLRNKIDIPEGVKILVNEDLIRDGNDFVVKESEHKEKQELSRPGIIHLTLIEKGEKEDLPLSIREPLRIKAFVPNLSGNILKIHFKNLSPYTISGTLELDVNNNPHKQEVSIERFKNAEYEERLMDFDKELDIKVNVKTKVGRFDYNRKIRTAFALKIPTSPSFNGDWSGWQRENPLLLIYKDQVRQGEREWAGPKDLSGKGFLNYDDKNLYIGLSIVDDRLVLYGRWRKRKYFTEEKRHLLERMYDSDSFQVYFDVRMDENQETSIFTPGSFGFLFAPCMRSRKIAIAEICSEWSDISAIDGVWYPTDSGYDVFVKIPLDVLGIRSIRGEDKIGFDIILNDNDGTERRNQQMVWSGARGGRIWLHQQYHFPNLFGYLFFQGDDR